MKHVISFSGGLSSWMTARLVKAEHGVDDMTLLFADTMIEDEDLYRFLTDASEDIGVPITRIADGRTPWQVFRDEKLIGNSYADPCSKILKRELLNRWRKENCTPEDSIHYVGLGWWEPSRVEHLPARFLPWTVKMPLAERFDINPENLQDIALSCGIAPPRLYAMGFTHNNCGGFCVKGGQAAFARLHAKFPERYAMHEEEERVTRAMGINGTVINIRRGSKKIAITLEKFREGLEADPFGFNSNDEGGCGCALPV